MDFVIEPERRIPVVNSVDVLVCGGGFAGVAAAVAAARNGASVMLIERYGFLGGLATAGLVITTPPLNNGINREIARRLKSWDSYKPNKAFEEIADSDIVDGGDGLGAYDPETTKVEFVRMLQEQGVTLLLHSWIAEVIVRDGRIEAALIENKAGRTAVRAKLFVDATGDADIAVRSGAPARTVERPLTLMVNLADVDSQRALAHLGTWNGLKKVVREAVARGDLAFDLGTEPDFGAPGIFAFDLIHPGQINLWTGMMVSDRILDPGERTRAEVVTRDHAFRLTRFLKKTVPGFEKARLEQTSTEVGIRATRNLVGEAVPSKEEICRGEFPDTVARPYLRKNLAVPYRSLLPRGIDNLLVAGRCISAADEIMGRLRLLPVCSATGEAAGVAAALALRQDVPPRRLDIGLLQRTLEDQGVTL